MSKNVLIIGISSMLGQRLSSYLGAADFQIFSCGRSDDCDIQYDLERQTVPTVRDGLKAECLFHCASAFADDSMEGCLDNERINALSAHVVAELADSIGCKHLVYAGSIFSSDRFPMTSYGASKSRAEDILEWSLGRKRIAFTSLRFPQLYDEQGECCRHQPWFGRIVAYAHAGKVLRLPGGRAKRNYLHVADAVRLMRAAVDRKATGTLAVSHPESTTSEEIARQAYNIFSNGGRYEIAEEKQRFHPFFVPESTASFEQLDCWPEVSMHDGLQMIKSAGSPQKFGPMDVN